MDLQKNSNARKGGLQGKVVMWNGKEIKHITFKFVMKITDSLCKLINAIQRQKLIKQYFGNENLKRYSFIVSNYKLFQTANIQLSDLCELTAVTNKEVNVHVMVNPKLKEITILDIFNDNEDNEFDPNNMFIKWKKDTIFLRIQKSIHMDTDPMKWTPQQVMIWLKCAALELKINGIRYDLWKGINGEKLCNLTIEEYQILVPLDNNKLLWSHLFILKNQQWFALLDFNVVNQIDTKMKEIVCSSYVKFNIKKSNYLKRNQTLSQFMYNLLENPDHTDIIIWEDKDKFIFKIVDPYLLSIVWGYRMHVYGYKLTYFRLITELQRDPNFLKVKNISHVWKFVDNIEEIVSH